MKTLTPIFEIIYCHYQEVKQLVSERDWAELLAADQLRLEHGAAGVFQGFTEGPVTFPPTYKCGDTV